ncbi:response regulator transcription factor [Symbioplanes lichenis]|uniref:response regulator transcription factor n=1 Tax=Symbioplanes lichenis TaxID=1629072 RepID=UPI0027385364|nr:response regulator [Actinoplanes lichenis]
MTTVTSAVPGSRHSDPGRPARILVVDDEPALTELLTLALSYEGWEVRSAGDGAAALELATLFPPDAVLLDMMLPDLDGVELLRRLRATWPALPMMFVTARDSEEDRAAGLRAGADAYLTKPFGLDDLLAHVRELLAPAVPGQSATPAAVLRAGDLELRPADRTVRRGGATIPLTTAEFDVLRTLAAAAGEPVAAAELAARLPGGRTDIVALCVAALRRKLGPVIEAGAALSYRLL